MDFESRKFACGVLTILGAVLTGATALPARAETSAESANDSAALQEITVTARRRDESIHDTPLAVTSVSAAMLEAKAAVNIGDLQGAVPNLLITQQNSGAAAANLSMRGLTFADVEKSFDPTVAVVVDGVAIGTSTGQYLDLFDIGSIEVLRGPQGTLFGRNTIGGVINVTRTRPTGVLGGKFELSYGRFGTVAGRGVFNVPITDVLAAKLFYFQNRSDGYYRDGISGRPRGGSENKNFGLSLLLAPKNTSFEALLTVEKQKQSFDVVNSNLVNKTELFSFFEQPSLVGRNTSSDLYTVFGTPADSSYDAPAATLQLKFDAGGVKVTAVTGYRKSDEDQSQDFDSASEALLPPATLAAVGLATLGFPVSAPLYFTRRIQSFHQFSQELRGAGKFTDTLDYVVGAYYYDSAYQLTQFTNFGGLGFAAPQVVSGTAKSLAGFADFDWAFFDRWRLNFGGRYTQDKKSLLNYDPGFLGNPNATFSKFTPKVGVDFRPTSDYMLYASWSVGYRSGGFSNRAATVTSTNTAFQPETVDSTEVGVKAEFLDKKLSVNLAVFDAKYKNMQQNTTIPGGPTGNQTIVSNVGSSVIRGVEIEVTARPTAELTLTGALGTLSSHFNGFITQAPVNGVLANFDYSANHLIYNPPNTLSLGADYKIPLSFGELHSSLGFRHIAAYDQQISLGATTTAPNGTIIVHGNDPRVRSDAQNLLDASITTSWMMSNFKTHLTLYGRNLTNDLGPSAAFTVAGLWSFASAREPRTYGLAAGLAF